MERDQKYGTIVPSTRQKQYRASKGKKGERLVASKFGEWMKERFGKNKKDRIYCRQQHLLKKMYEIPYFGQWYTRCKECIKIIEPNEKEWFYHCEKCPEDYCKMCAEKRKDKKIGNLIKDKAANATIEYKVE